MNQIFTYETVHNAVFLPMKRYTMTYETVYNGTCSPLFTGVSERHNIAIIVNHNIATKKDPTAREEFNPKPKIFTTRKEKSKKRTSSEARKREGFL